MRTYVAHFEDNDTNTYEFTTNKPRFVDINNIGANDLTFETNLMDSAMTVPAGEPFGGIDFGPISSIKITATSDYILVLSKVFTPTGE